MTININDIFISIQDEGVSSLSFELTGGLSDNGEPIADVKASGVNTGLQIRTLIFPNDANLSETDFDYLIQNKNLGELNEYILNSGYYLHQQSFRTSGNYEHRFNISTSDENQVYQLGYLLGYPSDDDEISVFEEYKTITSESVVIPPSRPNPNNLYVDSTISSPVSDTTYLNLTLYTKNEINNYNNAAYTTDNIGPYLIEIYNEEEAWYARPDGSLLTYPDTNDSNNYFNQSISGMVLTLPLVSGTYDSAKTTYTIDLYNVSISGDYDTGLIFNTKSLNLSSDDFDEGKVELFENISLEKVDELDINKDIVSKKRYMIGIEDLGIVTEQYLKQGYYISEFYTIDDPIYTFLLKVGETLPNIQGVNPYDTVKYFVQFHNQDWVRVSPVTRSNEIDNNNKTVPSFIILDDLNIGQTNGDLFELIYDSPIYSFRIKIEFDMSFLDNNNFISPSVDYFECHVTDRNSFLKVE